MTVPQEFTALDIFFERAATVLSYVLLFSGLVTLVDGWRVQRRTLWLIMAACIAVLVPVLVWSDSAVVVKYIYYILVMVLFTLLHRTRNRTFWLGLFLSWACSTLSGVISAILAMPLDLRFRFLIKLPLVVLVFFFLRAYLRPLLRALLPWKSKSLGYLTVLSVGLLSFLIAVSYAIQEYAQNDDDYLYFLVGAMLAILLTLCVAILYYFFSLRRQQQDEFDNDLLMTQMLAIGRRAEELLQQSRAERGFIHDLRHNIRALSQCLEAGEVAGARALTQRLQESLTGLTQARTAITEYTGQPVLDATITFYCGMAQDLGIPCEVALRLPDALSFDVLEFTTVMANALENAVNACNKLAADGGTPFIRVLGEIVRGQWLFSVANTCAEALLLDPQTGLPTTRELGHGFGVRSIQHFAEKTGGMLDYRMQDGVLTLRLALPLEGAKPPSPPESTPRP